ncbi:site-specific integrase [Lysinibacillus xylanilyticus]|uniref:hypothetical protein n=1 Tax=Lysinibacillus xylanilyticus TaxID=582475 RepID=UPI003812435B
MNYVQPIRVSEKIDAMKVYLKNKRERDYMLFLIGISVGLRIADILKLRKEDVLKSHIDIRKQRQKA